MDQTLEKIIDIMKSQAITDLEMQVFLGIPKGSFSNWKRGKGKSYYEHIASIADRLGVTIDYLVRGETMMNNELTHDERGLIQNFRLVNEERRKLIIKNVEFLAKS